MAHDPRSTAAKSESLLPTATIYAAADLTTRGRDEWVLANGLGGFAMGTAGGIPERRYHAMLIAGTTPPVGRVAALQTMVEWLVVEHHGVLTRHPISALRFAGDAVSPADAAPLARFSFGQSCTWAWRIVTKVGVFMVERELILHHARNAATVRYRLTREQVGHHEKDGTRLWIEARPLVSLRDFHALLTPGEPHAHQVSNLGADGVTVSRMAMSMELRIDPGQGRFASGAETWRNVEYTREHERGMDGVEDLWSPGVFILAMMGDHLPHVRHGHESAGSHAPRGGADRSPEWHSIVCEVATPTPLSPVPEAEEELAAERARLEPIVRDALAQLGPAARNEDRDAIKCLVVAADRFVVKRQVAAVASEEKGAAAAEMSSIIAGYPWFADWGRDTCICLPGLLLRCGRFAEAKRCLAAFAAYRRRGLVPCTFDDGSGAPQYNTVDASLWYIHAACDYLRVTGDRAGFDASMRAACVEIVEHYRKGTDFSIRVDPEDGLVCEGNEQTQLTWMDAKRDGVVFTPRFGKPVEINALWYSALLELAGAIETASPKAARELHQWADQAGRSFAKFWNAERGCLFDCLRPTLRGGWEAVADVRPNQVFAIALPHSALTQEQQASVLRVVQEQLLTREGLRTLEPGSAAYCPRFEGVLFERDRAYHNGTVWPWLIGPYVDAVLRVGKRSTDAYREAREAIAGLMEELVKSRDVPGPVGTLAEVYDADALDAKRRPEGCLAQAWSVGELIRVIGEVSRETRQS
jgi:glycogen debranching enzyme